MPPKRLARPGKDRSAMKPMTEAHLAILRLHMVEVIDMHFDLAAEEIGRVSLSAPLRRALRMV